jgi:GTP cyclohydrolase I
MAKRIEKINDGSGMESEGYTKTESWDSATVEELSTIYYRVLKLIGEDPDREGLKGTPLRVAKAMTFLTNGYNQNPCAIINSANLRKNTSKWFL